MNKNLPKKLAAKAVRVQAIIADSPGINPFGIGVKAAKLLKGSYGKTINPYSTDKLGRISHAEFRDGFKSTRKLAKLGA